MREPFKPGDVVVCVNAGLIERAAYFAGGIGLRLGATYRVLGLDLDEEDGALLLVVRPGAYLADRFRKIDPADEQFTRQVRACRPIREKVDA